MKRIKVNYTRRELKLELWLKKQIRRPEPETDPNKLTAVQKIINSCLPTPRLTKMLLACIRSSGPRGKAFIVNEVLVKAKAQAKKQADAGVPIASIYAMIAETASKTVAESILTQFTLETPGLMDEESIRHFLVVIDGIEEKAPPSMVDIMKRVKEVAENGTAKE